jgi:hypothetical protein
LPGINDKYAEVLEYLLTEFGLGVVTDELGGSTAASYVLLKGAEEFSVGFTTIYVTDLCLGTDVELGTRGTIVNSRCVRVDIVGSEWFVAACDI